MGYSKPIGQAIHERLTDWYLFRRDFPMNVEQLLDLLEIVLKPYRGRTGNQCDELASFTQYVNGELYKRHKAKHLGMKNGA